MPRISLKMVGASGQGVNSIGAIIAKGLKRSGYCVFGYREYPSLIKGGHASYQLDISNQRIRSTETKVNVLVALNHHGLELNYGGTETGRDPAARDARVAVSGASSETHRGTKPSRHLFPG